MAFPVENKKRTINNRNTTKKSWHLQMKSLDIKLKEFNEKIGRFHIGKIMIFNKNTATMTFTF